MARGIFGAPMAAQTAAMQVAALAGQDPARTASPPPTFSPRKRTLSDNLGLLADAFRGDNRNGQGLQQRDRQDQQLWLAQQRPQQEFAEWQRQFDYKQAHPDPVEPNALERNRAYLNSVAQGLGDTYTQNFANNGGGAPQIMNIPGIGTVAVPRGPSSVSGGNSPPPPPPAAVEMLKKNPALAPQFDQKYGPGASQRFMQGGAPSSGGGTFRP